MALSCTKWCLRGGDSKLRCTYVLPDYQSVTVGYVKSVDEDAAAEPAAKKARKEDVEEDEVYLLVLLHNLMTCKCWHRSRH